MPFFQSIYHSQPQKFQQNKFYKGYPVKKIGQLLLCFKPKLNFNPVSKMHFTELSGRHSVLERPLSEVNGRLFFSQKTTAYRVLILTVQCFVALFMMELADTSSLRIIAFQLSGSRCEHTMVLFLCSFRFSRSSKRILISLSSVIV